jgi:hypothetical protein
MAPLLLVVRRLGTLRERMVFVGGMVRGLLITDPGAVSDSAPPTTWTRSSASRSSASTAKPADKGRSHRLVKIQVLGPGLLFDFAPDGRGQAHGANDGLPRPALAGMPSAKKNGIGRELRHFPQSQKRRAPLLAGSGEGVAPHRAEPSEVDLGVQRVSRLRSALFHASSPSAR